jgi:hypothetical protein
MAFTTPTTTGPDQVQREETVFSTTFNTRFFDGVMGADTVDMEVSIRGGEFTSDPDFILFEGASWQVPNSAAFPDGLELVSGLNTIEVRAISTTGTVSASATIEVTLVQERDIDVVALPPTNISMQRLNNAVEITAESPDDTTTLQGINFYASQNEGGGATGYRRINLNLIGSGTTQEETEVISQTTATSPIATVLGGGHAADPLFIRVTQTQEDDATNQIQEDFTETLEVSETVNTVRTTIVVESVRESTFFSFQHRRSAGPTSDPATISNGSFAALPLTDPLYYVVTATYFDSARLLEIESSFSAEVVGNPVQVTSAVGSFPVVTRQRIAQNTIEAIFRSNPQLRVDPGAPLRDTFIDPFSSEAERVRFIVDFLHRTQSFTTLIQVDDPNNTGTSLAPGTSAYKQALKAAFFLTRDQEVQNLIDRAFEALASNYGVFRLAGIFARGETTFFTTRRPTSSVPIPLGSLVSGGSREYRTTQPATLPLNNLASFFDPISKRYLIRVPVQASAVGSAGNVGAGQIRTIKSAISGLSVINEAAMFGGANQETNRQLAERAQNALASVDAGTRRGYLQTAADVPGVVQANVVNAGHVLMQRDLDEDGVHRGGKVDVWIQGENLASVTDTFAFTFEIAQNIQFELQGDPSNLVFKAVDPALSASNSIIEMLDEPAIGFEFKNVTSGQVFDLTDVAILSFDSIQLSTDVAQPAVTLTDVVLGDYRRRAGTQFTLTRQPVRSLTSVTGVVSGELDSASVILVHPASPLGNGRSALAGDFLDVTGSVQDDGSLVPSGDTIPVTNETHTIIGEFPEFLDNLGANAFTIVVTSADSVTTYKGPNDPSGTPDYTIILGGQTTAISIKRTSGSTISSGDTVLISYDHDENFTVEYVTNLVVSTVQDAVEIQRHATADVLAKEVVTVPVDITATIVLGTGTQVSDADTAIRTNLENFFARLRLGDPVRQSDIIEILDSSSGVDFVIVPLAQLARGAGSTVVRETISTDQAGDSVLLDSLSSSLVAVFLLDDELSSNTSNGGGDDSDFRGVFQTDVELALQTSLGIVSLAIGRAFIVGFGGISISGYSDDATLDAEGYETPEEKQAERATRTGNRVIVSVATGDSPSNYDYTATYVTVLDASAKNIDPSDAEVLEVGELTFTYDEAG